MNNSQLYEEIPFLLLERLGFPINYIELNLDQKEFIDTLFYQNSMITKTNIDLQDRIYELEDKVADLEHELKDLAGEK